MRRLAAAALSLGILLVPALALAAWTDVKMAEHYVMCRQAGGSDALCTCTIAALVEIQPERTKVSREDIHAAVQSCVLPKPPPGSLSI